MDIFSLLLPKYTIDKNKKIRLISLFSGYDSQKLAFNYLGIDVEHYRAIEFDKYAIQTLNEIHNTNFETQDITKVSADKLGIVDTENYTYVLTYSFPCTDLSLAGKRAGMDKESGTRSGLLWEVERLLKETKEKPQILIMENVPQVLSAKGWREWNVFLENLGYSNYAQVLNAKNFGIPQNRERCFMVSILGDYSYEFPRPFELKDRLKDFLENDVDEKYYLSDRMIQGMKKTNFECYKLENKILNKDGVANTILARFDGAPQCVKEEPKIKILGKYIKGGFSAGQIVDDNGITPTFMEHHSNIMAVVENQNMKTTLCNSLIENGVVKENYVVNHSYTNGLNGKNPNSRQTLEDYIETTDNSSLCLTTRPDTLGVVVKDEITLKKDTPNYIEWEEKGKLDIDCRAWKEETVAPTTTTTPKTKVLLNDLRIRKLTPCECFKLMGVKPTDYEKITCSNAQKYKQAGNSIVTTCLMAIYSQLFENVDYKYYIEELLKELRTK